MTTKSLPPEQNLVPETRSETPERRGRDDREIQPGPVQPNRWRTYVFAGGGYLLLSLFVWSNLWTRHPTSTTTCGCSDSSLFTWFLAWPPYALSHGLNPFFSTALNHPTGVNLLANTSELAIGVLLAPVTWLFGVIAALNLALILSPVLSALAMFFLLRRWVAWSPAAFIGGLAYGFSPFVLGSLNDAHLMLGMAAVPPLVVAGLDEMLVRQLRPPVLIGILLGLLVVVQFFVGTEVLLITTIMATVSVVLVVLYAAIEHPEVLRRRARHVAVGLSAGAVTAGALLAYPAWFALAGPAHPSGPIWPGMNLATGYGASTLKGFFVPSRLLTLQFDVLHSFGAFAKPPLSWQYFGIGIPVVLGTGLIVWRRDRRLWLFAMVALISASLSLGVSKSLVLPWQLLADLPQMENVTPLRFVLITYLAAGVMLGLIVDHTYVAVTRRREAVRDGSPQPPSQVRLPRSARWAGAAVGTIVAGIALLPVAWFLAPSVPIAAQPVVLPTWFRTVAPHLQGRQVLLVVPAAFSLLESSMTWQAVDRMPFSMVGIGGPGDYGSRAGEERDGEAVITAISYLAHVQLALPGSILVVRQALEDWGVTMVVIPDQGHLPAYDQTPSMTNAAALFSAAIGMRPVYQAGAWVWTGVNHAPRPVLSSSARYSRCTTLLGPRGTPTVDAAVECILGTAGEQS